MRALNSTFMPKSAMARAVAISCGWMLRCDGAVMFPWFFDMTDIIRAQRAFAADFRVRFCVI
ncbi:hypothetical protein C1850_10405 [Adlercreutzia equolifaciens subsp. celatus]|uniref:Uncharacterized protein n=1 Tax=Adlercreutzia equolifaciens subsp. celatus TaxID=394340 RepID=A0A369NYL4_9ACTN|nr:hypothetical protein C1850_10405 [Adlercreutzia equolifaciens subsp. celatus]